MDKVDCDMICKNHSARLDRDQYRICPTKLSKSELEDLYFTLIESNLDLKKTINVQQDRIKMLSTKMQRISSAQKIYKPEGNKNGCVATKTLVNQQKEIITDLKLSNERMADRIRKLNMRLCSAKQFCKSITPSLRCSTATSPYLIKNSSCGQQQSQSTLKLAVSCQNLSRRSLSTKHTQTEALESTKQEKNSCNDNKCSSMMEDLKQKIIDLEEELLKANEDHLAHTKALQLEVEEFRIEAIREKSERVAIEHELQKKHQKIAVLTTSLRAAEGITNELKTELSIERRKVVELETRLKAATMSDRVAKTIEDTLNSIQESNKIRNLDSIIQSPHIDSQQTYPGISIKGIDSDDTKLSKSADDSGYIDTRSNINLSTTMDDQSLNKIIEELTKRIIVLQTQVDALTISSSFQPTLERNDEQYYNLVKDKNEIDAGVMPPVPSPKVIENASNDYTNESIDTANQRSNEESSKESILISDNNINETKSSSPKIDTSNTLQVPNDIKSGKWQKNMTKLVMVRKKTNEIDKAKENIDSDNNDKDIEITPKEVDNNDIKEENSKQSEMKSPSTTVDKPIDKEYESSESNDRTYNVVRKDNKTSKTKNDVNREVPKVEIEDKNVKSRNEKRLLIKSKSVIEKPPAKEKRKNNIKQKTVVKPEPVDIKVANVGISDEGTYTIDGENNNDASADNTDYEISSMTDLSEEMEPKIPPKRLLSPGEQKDWSIHTESFTTNTTNFSLSEGEIPTNTVRRRSQDDNSRTNHVSTPKMEETLQAISEEIARCKRLMSTQRQQYNVMPTIK